MIYCIEYVKYDWGHQDVNSGVLYELALSFPNEPITVMASQRHIGALKKFIYPGKLVFRTIELPHEQDNFKDVWIPKENYKEIGQLLRGIGLQPEDKVIFFFGTASMIDAIGRLAQNYRNNKFYICIHEKMEKITRKPQDKVDQVWQKTIRKMSKVSNLWFIQYHPDVNELIAEKYGSAVAGKFIFLYHPSENNSKIMVQEKTRNHMNVTVLGAAVFSEYTKPIIATFLRKYDTDKIDFNIYVRGIGYNETIRNEHIRYVRRFRGFTEEEIHAAIINCDYLLIPYDKRRYTVVASGICADAIRYNKPVIALDSPYIKAFNDRMPIGIVGCGVEDLIDKISPDVLEKNKEQYINNEKKWIHDIRKYNIDKIKEVMQ